MYFLSRDLYFPPVSQASPEGVLAIGGDLTPERLMLAYRNGISRGLITTTLYYGGARPKGWYCF